MDAEGMTVLGLDHIFGDVSGWSDPSDPISLVLREPQVAVGPKRDAGRQAVGRRHVVLDDRPAWRDSADSIAGAFGEPEIPVRTRGDDEGAAEGIGDLVLGDGAERSFGGDGTRPACGHDGKHAQKSTQKSHGSHLTPPGIDISGSYAYCPKESMNN